MKDVTKKFFKQSKEFGRTANLNITRRGMYKNKINSIYRLLEQKHLIVGIVVGNTVAGHKYASRNQALQIVDALSEKYFLKITYAANHKTVLVRLTGSVPSKEEQEPGRRPETYSAKSPGLQKTE